MGMSSDEFWQSTAKELFLRMKTFFDYQTFLQNQEWARTRWQTTILVNLQIPKKNKQIKPQDLFEFDWEKKPINQNQMDPQLIQELNEKWDAEMKAKHQQKTQTPK